MEPEDLKKLRDLVCAVYVTLSRSNPGTEKYNTLQSIVAYAGLTEDYQKWQESTKKRPPKGQTK